MKALLFFLLLPLISEAKFSKPQLVARLSASGAWNAPDNMWCFLSEPAILKDQIHLGCRDDLGYLMGQWSEKGFRVLARAEGENFFSRPVSAFNEVSWNEYDELKIFRSYKSAEVVDVSEVSPLGPLMATDSLLPVTPTSWIYRLQGGSSPEIWLWEKDHVVPFFNPGAAYIFSPQVGSNGEIAFKTRDHSFEESSPDRLWLFNGSWKVVLEDKDANPDSPWIRFSHQLSVEGNKILTVAADSKGEVLILIEDGKVTPLARRGVDLASFDAFNPEMRSGTIVIRGMDFEGRKAIYVHDGEGFRKLLTQGDVVHTDVGLGRVEYKNRDAIFYGAPGVDEKGNVFLQATLTDADYSMTLLGIGLIKFTKE